MRRAAGKARPKALPRWRGRFQAFTVLRVDSQAKWVCSERRKNEWQNKGLSSQSLPLLPPSFSSQTSGPSITDIQPAVGDNEDLIGAARSVSVSQDGPRSCPKPIFSAL